MSLPLYLAMTAAEISLCQALPEQIAYMACHFSPYSTGLSNLPDSLPKGSMVILNDRTPIAGHDPELVAKQLYTLCTELGAEKLLLDLQRPNEPQTERIIGAILQDPPCQTAVSDIYAKDLGCPVFLSAPSVDITLEEHMAPWRQRDIWLEAALDSCICTVTESGSQITACLPGELPLSCPQLHCHYKMDSTEDSVQIALSRNLQDLSELMNEAERLSVTTIIGLYQQLGTDFLNLV